MQLYMIKVINILRKFVKYSFIENIVYILKLRSSSSSFVKLYPQALRCQNTAHKHNSHNKKNFKKNGHKNIAQALYMASTIKQKILTVTSKYH